MNNRTKNTLICLTTVCILCLFLFYPVHSPAQEPSGLQIMINEDTREDGDDQISSSIFNLINKRGQKRVRDTVRRWKDYDEKDGFDEKTILFFKSPPEIEGTGFLNWSYPDINKDDDQWLYLPALRKIKRISGNDKEDSFMGTDFTFDDMGDREVEEDTHKRTGQETFEDKKCYIVESIPKEKNYIYSKKILWVTDGEWIVPKIDFYDRKGRLLKHLKFEWHKVQDIWAWKRVTMKNVQTGHQTIVEVKDTKFNQGFKNDLFTQRTLRREGK